MRTLRDKTALVTGAASGIGRALACQLAEEGVHLFLVDINAAGLAEISKQLRAKPVNCVTHQCDVTQVAQISACVQRVLDQWGGVDLLVNNAGIAYYGQTSEMTAECCERLLAVNLHAPIHFSRELLPSMLERPEAHIINVASFFGLIGTRKVSAYTGSKFGLVGFSESLRAEYARHGVGVTALCPGFVDTNLFAAAPLGSDRTEQKLPPRWMLTTPERIARRALKAIRRNEALVVTQAYARLAYLGKRWFPGLIDLANHLSLKRFKANRASAGPCGDEHRKAA